MWTTVEAPVPPMFWVSPTRAPLTWRFSASPRSWQGGYGSVDNCTVQNNGHHGIAIEAASAKVINSTISSNTSTGIMVQRGASARIGMNDVVGEPTGAGNTISKNQGSGIFIYAGGSAYIVANTIQENGTNPNSVYGRNGINIGLSTAVLAGENTITANQGWGVSGGSSSVSIGVSGLGVSTRNTITGNGVSSQNIGKGGVIGANGAHLSIFDADISNNVGDGVNLWLGSSASINASSVDNNMGNGLNLGLRSTAIITGGTVNNNTGNGIQIGAGSGLSLGNPAVTVTGNTGYDLQCNDEESSYGGNAVGISNVSEACTGF